MSFQVYVGNYPYDYSRNDLVSLFKDFEGVTLQKWFKKEQKSYCFFACDDIEQVVSVIQKMNNAEVSGRKLIVRASDQKLHKYVELILQESKGDPETLKEKESHVARKNTKEISHNSSNSPPFVPARKNTKEISHNSSNSPPFVPVQVLRNKTAHKMSPISCSDVWETFSSHSKSPSSHSSFSERSYNHSHRRFSNNSLPKEEDDEFVWLSVTNFPLNTPIRSIYELFNDYEPLKVIMLCNEPRRDKTLTEAHVCFMNREVADDVIMNFDNTMYEGRLLLVNDIEDLTVMRELVNVVH